MSVLVGIGCAAAGALLGPFLAALTRRVPDDGAPVLGRDAWRGAPASRRRRAVVTVLAAAVLGAIGAAFGIAAALPAFVWLGAVGVVLAVIDVDCHRLPDRLTLPSYPAGLVLLGAASVVRGDLGALLRAVVAAAALAGAFLVLALASPSSLGLGDVKLAGLLGLFLGWLGWSEVALGLVAGVTIGGVAAVGLLAGRRVGWRGELAYGPSLLAGALVAVVAGGPLADAYLSAGVPA